MRQSSVPRQCGLDSESVFLLRPQYTDIGCFGQKVGCLNRLVLLLSGLNRGNIELWILFIAQYMGEEHTH